MWIGGMRDRVKIQRLVVTQDAAGGQVKTWRTLATVRARVIPLQGKEFFEAQKYTSEVTTEIRLRYIPGVKPSMRVIGCGATYDIQAVIDRNNRKRELYLMCKEVV